MTTAPNAERIVADVGRCLAEPSDGEPIIVAIAGPPGSGKSTLAATVLDALREQGLAAEPTPLDGWHRTEAELERRGLLEVKGAPETFDAVGYRRMLQHIRDVRQSGGAVDVPGFEHGLRDPQAGMYRIDATTRVVVTEGNYLFLRDAPWSGLRELFTLAYWISAGTEVLRERLVRRQVDTGKSLDQATAWVDRSDCRNIEIVNERSALDTVVHLA